LHRAHPVHRRALRSPRPVHPADGAAAVRFAGAVRWFWNKSGFEYPAIWALGALYFLVNGGGTISIDHLLGFEF